MDKITTLLPLVLLIAIMYFMLIRPQKKREKEVNNMRNSIQVGDEVITIGGICGKIVKTKDDVLTIQVGADKTKFEIMRWAISKVVTEKPAPSKRAPAKEESDQIEAEEDVAAAGGSDEGAQRKAPKRLRKKSPEEEAGLEE